MQGAFALLLARMSGESDVVFGATRAGRATSVPGADGIVGLFIATLPVRVALRPEQSLADWLRALRASEREARPHEHTPLVELQGWSELRAGAPLFESLLVFDHSLLDSQMRAKGPAYETRRFRLHERTNYALTLYAYAEPRLLLKLAFDEPRFDADAAGRLLDHLAHLLAEIARDPAQPLAAVTLLSAAERERLVDAWNDTAARVRARGLRAPAVRGAGGAHARRRRGRLPRPVADATPSSTSAPTALARRLRGARASGPTCWSACSSSARSRWWSALLAVLKAGGAYVPLDPALPARAPRVHARGLAARRWC